MNGRDPWKCMNGEPKKPTPSVCESPPPKHIHIRPDHQPTMAFWACLPQEAVAQILCQLTPIEWGRLCCASRALQEQLLRVLGSTPVSVVVDCSIRSWRSAVAAAGRWCRCVTGLTLLEDSSKSLQTLELLVPLLQPTLTHLSLHGFKLNSAGCNAQLLVGLLLQHCPLLQQLDLQDCDLPHLGIFQRLVTKTAVAPHTGQLAQQQQQQQEQQQQQGQQQQPSSRSCLRVLNLTGARLAPGPSYDTSAPTTTPTSAAAAAAPAAAAATGTKSQAAAAATAAGATKRVPGLQELHLGCRCDEVDTAWLHSSSAVTTQDVTRLLGSNCQDLRVLDVCKRPGITDDLLRHLAAHPPTRLHTLDVSLTRVTPAGLLQLLQHCPQLAVLRYACRSGDEGLDAPAAHSLAAAMPALRELDLSLHPKLDNACLAALAQCTQLIKVTFARSHKISSSGVEQLVSALPQLQVVEIVRCRGVSAARLAASAAATSPGLVVQT